ncbi:hypothetical protein [Paracoccus tibetensis]|uniref:Uncharacterized protein n=1 Tax=Paracoccus tibetensis TaxID=336292 RepID=A0A1G5IXS6_9RHOB|nr:hypothetical protein [Paracoccus tibetensis]SCY80684.1 hypothetical protein SAMN05660710_02844 [Paracoccus tibetensis]
MTAAKLLDDAQRFSASAASIAQDLERAAAGVDVACYAARAFAPLHSAAVSRIMGSSDRVPTDTARQRQE